MSINIPDSIREKIGRRNHLRRNHPVEIIKRMIYDYFGESFPKHEDLSPLVSVEDNFDALLIPETHPSRRLSDTFYESEDIVLRTHMTAHLVSLARKGDRHLVCGDVYRKDTIDSTHYPVFSQMDGYCIVDNDTCPETDLKKVLSGLIEALFPGAEYRFSKDYFPFTINSIEAEVLWNGRWIEILGGGTVHPEIMGSIGRSGVRAWAFGVGLDRLAMILFNIPRIQYLWTDDPRFVDQFKSGEIVEFKPYSRYPACHKDIAFWIYPDSEENGEWLSYHDLCEMVRDIAGDLVEDISLIDRFVSKQGKVSRCYRISYRSMDRSLLNDEINQLQDSLRERIDELGAILR